MSTKQQLKTLYTRHDAVIKALVEAQEQHDDEEVDRLSRQAYDLARRIKFLDGQQKKGK